MDSDEPGLVYLNNRYHDPAIGGFISVDPLVVQTEEAYVYGSGNPISLSDPSGLCSMMDPNADACHSARQAAAAAVADFDALVAGWLDAAWDGTLFGNLGDGWSDTDEDRYLELSLDPEYRRHHWIAYAVAEAGAPVDVVEAIATDPDRYLSGTTRYKFGTQSVSDGLQEIFSNSMLVGGLHQWVLSASNPCRSNSFVAGTEVLMADGSTKPIEDVQVGDLVWARDPVTGEVGPRRVSDVIVGEGLKDLVDVWVDGQSLTATAQHPFWVDDDGRWVDAADLQRGDDLLSADGTTTDVDQVRDWSSLERVHNLTVDGIHTYYVVSGNETALVHNCLQPTRHSVNQKINREIRSADELDAYKNPLHVTPIRTDHHGRPSVRYVGRRATIAVNPQTDRIVSVNPTSTRRVRKYE